MSYYLMTYKTTIEGGYEMMTHYPIDVSGEFHSITYAINEILYEQWFQPDKEAHLMSDNPYTGYNIVTGKQIGRAHV